MNEWQERERTAMGARLVCHLHLKLQERKREESEMLTMCLTQLLLRLLSSGTTIAHLLVLRVKEHMKEQRVSREYVPASLSLIHYLHLLSPDGTLAVASATETFPNFCCW